MKKSNERGSVLPLVLIMVFLSSSLLLGLSEKIAAQSLTLVGRDTYLKTQLAEKITIHAILDTITDSDFEITSPYSETLMITPTLRPFLYYYHPVNGNQQVEYTINTSDGIIKGRVIYKTKDQTYTLQSGG